MQQLLQQQSMQQLLLQKEQLLQQQLLQQLMLQHRLLQQQPSINWGLLPKAKFWHKFCVRTSKTPVQSPLP